MYEYDDLLIHRVYRLRFIFLGVLAIIMALVLFWMLLAGMKVSASSAPPTKVSFTDKTSFFDKPNAVMAGMAVGAHALGNSTKTIQSASSATVNSFAAAGAWFGRGSVYCATSVAKGIGGAAAFVGGAFVNGVVAVVKLPLNLMGFMSHNQVVGSVIKPDEYNPVPIIDPNSPQLAVAQKALAAAPVTTAAAAPAKQPEPVVDTSVVWPIHGMITTEFGVSELPYQAVHTGLDISDGQRSGVTPIRPFRHGRVIVAERSGGLGNHVIVDHGSGVTSVYGHLAVITVSVGQVVDTSTMLGREGSTGVSTGPHLHFEVRVNGQAANPHQFISGHP